MRKTDYRVGLVVHDDYQHAVRKRLLGGVALCGAGRIVVLRPGLFDPHGLLACHACREAAATSR